MPLPDDAELLRRYADEGADDAFAEIVRRHIDLVYAVALRRVGGDAHLAQDVAQRVFTDVARKATALASHAVLAGWLHRAAHFAATDVVRAERRRRDREQEAQAMQELSPDPSAVADWDRLRPMLDEAIAELAERDRDAIALRFFGGRAFAEIGATLRLTEDAARMRVDRALERLGEALRRRGITSTAAALAIALGGQMGVAAPGGLAATVTGAALAAMATPWLGVTKLQGALMAALLVTGVALVWQEHAEIAELAAERSNLQRQLARVAKLRAETMQLARAEFEVTSLRMDDLELARLRDQAAELAERLKRPVVTPVTAPRNVVVSGKVRTPGRFRLTENPITLGELVRQAGGLTDTALANKVRVTRTLPDGALRSFVFDLRNGADNAFVIEANDIIYVPEIII